VEVNGSGKHSSLLRYGMNYGLKSFIVQVNWQLKSGGKFFNLFLNFSLSTQSLELTF